jgi:alkylation response protein AidB-like acyl-CoA dehydrogenase
MTHAAITDRPGVRNKLLAAVDRIRDLLDAENEAQERNAELSRASSNALYEAGILKMKLPAVLGGFEADLVTQFEVIEALSTISPAAGWCAMVGATSIGMPGAFLSDAGIAQMFADGDVPRGAILIMPSGQATPVAGGFRLSGRWAFASGVQHAQWVAAHGLMRVTPDAPPLLHMFVFPASSITIHDNWQVLGLRGTGSCDISVEDIFVPAELAWDVAAQPPQRGGALYRLGIPAFVAYEHAGFATGVARRALDTLTKLAIEKKRGYGPGALSLADRPAVQRLLGHSDLRLRAARALAVDLNQQAMDVVERGETPSARLALELRSSACYCTEVALDIVNQAFRYAGAGAIFESSVMQRCLRDINVAAQHLMVSEIAYELLGKTHLGFDDVQPMG